MSQILPLLSLYYLCDLAAAERWMNKEEVDRCMANYNELKLEFIDETPAPLGTPERAAQNLLGYRGLKAWEAANPELVEELRAEARLRLRNRP